MIPTSEGLWAEAGGDPSSQGKCRAGAGFNGQGLGNMGEVSTAKSLYKPLSLASSVVGGLVAGKIFTEVWERISPTDREPPEPSDLSRSTRDAFLAAAVQGLIVGLVRAALSRAQAHSFRALTHENPHI